MKHRATKLVIILLVIAAAIVGINGYLHYSKYKKDITPGSRFTESEINAATEAAVKQCKNFSGVSQVIQAKYDEASSLAYLTDYIENGAGKLHGLTTDNSLVLFLDFKTNGHTTALNANATYTHYAFIMVKHDDGKTWTLVDGGY